MRLEANRVTSSAKSGASNILQRGSWLLAVDLPEEVCRPFCERFARIEETE